MRILIALVFILAGAGCSSGPKKEAMAGSATTESNTPVASTSTNKPTKVAATKSNAGSGTITCSSKDDKRIIEVRAKDNGCETAYTKAGAESIVATSNSGTAHCEKVQGRIQENLKTAGFSCQ